MRVLMPRGLRSLAAAPRSDASCYKCTPHQPPVLGRVGGCGEGTWWWGLRWRDWRECGEAMYRPSRAPVPEVHRHRLYSTVSVLCRSILTDHIHLLQSRVPCGCSNLRCAQGGRSVFSGLFVSLLICFLRLYVVGPPPPSPTVPRGVGG